MPDPKPPYNTISSVVRILENKGFVSHKAYGKTHEYYPAISKLAYKKFTFKQLMANYFEGSVENVLSFIVNENEKELSPEDVKELKEIVDKAAEKKTNHK